MRWGKRIDFLNDFLYYEVVLDCIFVTEIRKGPFSTWNDQRD